MTDQSDPQAAGEELLPVDQEQDTDLNDLETEGEYGEAQPESEEEEVDFDGLKVKAPKGAKEKLEAAQRALQEAAELETRRTSWESERQAAEQEYQQRVTMQATFRREFGELAALEAEEARWQAVQCHSDAEKLEKIEALNEIRAERQAKGQALSQKVAQWQAYTAHQQQQSEAKQAEGYRTELKKLGFDDTAQTAAKEVAKTYGFTDEEWSANRDPRVVKVLKELADAKAQLKATTRKQSIESTPAVPTPIKGNAAPAALSDRQSTDAWIAARNAQQFRKRG